MYGYTLYTPCISDDLRGRGWIPGEHRGIDYGFYNNDPVGSQKILAAAGGKVVSVYAGDGYNEGWGNRIVIEHDNALRTAYSHIRSGGVLVVEGQNVGDGAHIANMGDTGDADGTHLHFEVYYNGTRVDPLPWLTLVRPPVSKIRRTVGSAGGTMRVGASTESRAIGDVVAGWWGDFPEYVIGEDAFGNGNKTWFKAGGVHMYSGVFTNASTDGMKLYTPPVVVPPVVTPPVEPPVVTPPVVTPPETEEPPVITPPVVPGKPNTVQIDLDKLDELGTAIGEQVGPYIPRDTRRKLYEIVRNVSAACFGASTVALSTAGVIGGEIGVKIAVGAAVLATVSTAIGALAAGLAKSNT